MREGSPLASLMPSPKIYAWCHFSSILTEHLRRGATKRGHESTFLSHLSCPGQYRTRPQRQECHHRLAGGLRPLRILIVNNHVATVLCSMTLHAAHQTCGIDPSFARQLTGPPEVCRSPQARRRSRQSASWHGQSPSCRPSAGKCPRSHALWPPHIDEKPEGRHVQRKQDNPNREENAGARHDRPLHLLTVNQERKENHHRENKWPGSRTRRSPQSKKQAERTR